MLIIDNKQEKQIVNLFTVSFIKKSGNNDIFFRFMPEISATWRYKDTEERDKVFSNIENMIQNSKGGDIDGGKFVAEFV